MTFSVSVPVLSVQITEVQPSVSTEESRLTRLSAFAIRRTPAASAIVVTAGRPSGMAAIARMTPVSSMSQKGRSRRRPRTVTRAESPMARIASRRSELLGLLLERSLLAPLVRDELSDRRLRAAADAGHHHPARAAHDRRAGPCHRRPVGERGGGVHRLRPLRDGNALAGERGLVGLQVVGDRDASVRGDDLAAHEHRGDHAASGPLRGPPSRGRRARRARWER